MTDTETTGRKPLDDAARAAVLNAEVAKYARQGWTVQSVTPGQAVLGKNKRIGWFWNLLLTIVTAGIWLIVVLVRVINRKKNTMIITVDPYGKIKRS